MCGCRSFLKTNLNAPRPSEHPPVRGKNVKTFRWDHRLQRQTLHGIYTGSPMVVKRVVIIETTIIVPSNHANRGLGQQ